MSGPLIFSFSVYRFYSFYNRNLLTGFFEKGETKNVVWICTYNHRRPLARIRVEEQVTE